jgi:hypothetical protein
VGYIAINIAIQADPRILVLTTASILISASAAMTLFLGVMHLVLTFCGDRFFPTDAALMRSMQEVSPRISRQTTIWRAGLGFHASHSLGAILFGSIYGYVAFAGMSFLLGAKFLLFIGFAYLVAMLVLAKRYWFKVPFRGIFLALVLYTAGALIALLS